MKVFLLIASILLLTISVNAAFDSWENHGGDILNHRNAPNENKIKKSKIDDVQVKWIFTTNYSVSATPAVSDEAVYFPSWDGFLYAVNRDSGILIWKRNVSEITGKPNDKSRATPVITGNYLIDGSQSVSYHGAILYAVNRFTGATVWTRQINPHSAAIITQSGTVYNGYIYVGCASLEEALATNPTYPCCSFQGTFSKVRVSDGVIIWTISMLQDLPVGPGNYSGNGVWGSSPAIDADRGSVYIATGNNYDTPPEVEACFNASVAANTSSAHCIEAGNYIDSVLSVRMSDGYINWAQKVEGYDAWTVACFFSGPNCPASPGPDYDFGHAPMLIRKGSPYNTINLNDDDENFMIDDDSDGNQDYLVVGQKSGIIWAFDADDGALLWSTPAGPGAALGGHNWGGSTDGDVSVFGIINGNNLPFVLQPGTEVITWGAWVALDNSDGEIIWSTAVPRKGFYDQAAGPTAIVNDVVFAGSADSVGTVYALSLKTGEIIWSYETGGSIYGGFSADTEGCVYIGSGYRPEFIPGFTSNNKVYAFCYKKK